MKKKLDKTFIKLSKHYDSLVRKYGDNVKVLNNQLQYQEIKDYKTY